MLKISIARGNITRMWIAATFLAVALISIYALADAFAPSWVGWLLPLPLGYAIGRSLRKTT